MSTEKIARFIVDTAYDNIPLQAVEIAKQEVIDIVGVTLAGSAELGSKIIVEYIRELGGAPEAGVFGCGFKAPAPLAALANGTLGHALDYDDVSESWMGHPSAAVLPAVLALGERIQASGKAVLTAYIIGFEIGAKIGVAIGMRHYDLGWHNTSSLGTIAAAAASAKLLGLKVAETRMALGIAASLACGLRQNFGTMTKPLHAGCAARNGITAAILASKGFTADENILEAPLGFCKVLGGGEACDLEGLAPQLGNPWDMITVGVSFKPYPSCRCTHPTIDATLALSQEHRFSAQDVAHVEFRTSRIVPTILLHHRPQTPLEGKFSMEYCAAAALIDGAVSLKQFTTEMINRPQIRELEEKMSFSHPDDWKQHPLAPQEVIIHLKDGKVLNARVDAPKGEPTNPLSWQELSNKYRDCASVALNSSDIERALEMMSNLEKLEDITKLSQIITFQAKVVG